MGPYTAATLFASRHADAARFDVTLYGSLAATGKGHMTDVRALSSLTPNQYNPYTTLFDVLMEKAKVQDNRYQF